ncbi:calcium-binding tyrosine phosphorylation-regulated protein isoform X2 [Apteryx rowi]|uniref:calcium-binding tyrosine phosphorylation-regulated protein isoform X2 n=1 Tax=Apteryx rowi TaxID=308060 RepID=UPI000E1CB722|nr:calcium-binding tyrosine phosphorylation-regulated protein isoform X2 [Apteryx rowi]
MHSSRARFVVPYGLKTLLEGVSRAVFQTNPNNITGFAALYFQELVAFREEDWNERLPQKLDTQDTSVPGEPKQKEKCTDTEEDQLLESPDTEYTSKMTQYPSTHNDIVEDKSPTGPDEASSPKGPELAYVPADSAQLAAQMLGPSADDVVWDPEKMESTAQMASAEQAMAASEAGQPPPYSNVWTLYCLTDLSQGQKSPPSLPPAGTGIPYPQATLYLSGGQDQQQVLQPIPLQGQPPQLFSPTYVMPEESKRGSVPPFILVGSTVQNTRDWKPIPGQAVLAQQDTGARRFTTIPVPVARPVDQQAAMPNPNPNAAQETARPPTPVFLSVAIPLDDVMSVKKGSPAGDNQTAMHAFAGSYSIAGQITVTCGPIHRAGS